MAKKKKAPKPNKTYKLKKAHTPTVKRLLSLDPGSRNFGISCVGLDSKGRVVVLANSVLTNPITNLVSNVGDSINIFHDEIARWVRMYRPDGFIMERFQSRGGRAGPLIELVSGMTLSVCTEYRHLPCKLITAATWKNKFNRRFREDEDDKPLDGFYKICRTTPHQLDASLIGVYGLEIGTNTDIDYEPLDIIAQVEAVSALPLRRIKGESK